MLQICYNDNRRYFMKKIRTIAAAAALVTALSCTAALTPSASAEAAAKAGISFNAENQTGWVTRDGKKYLYNKDGVMCVGWKKVNGKLYYFDSTGAMRTGLLKIGGNIYYLTEQGAVTGTTVEINGKSYTFDENGVLQDGAAPAAKTKAETSSIKFGMSMQEVEAILNKKYPIVMPLEDVVLLAAPSMDAKNAVIYFFDEEGKMQLYGEFFEKDKSDAYKKAFAKAGYKEVKLPTDGDKGLYVFKAGDQYAFIISSKGMKDLADDQLGSAYLVISPEIIKQLKTEGIAIEEELVSAFSEYL